MISKNTKTKNTNPNDATRAMQDMMQTIDVLRGIYVRETSALETTDTKTFLGMQNEKLEAAQKYKRDMESLMTRQEELKKVSPVLKGKLAAAQKEFSALAERNLEALQRMQRSTERLGETIMGAAKDAVRKKQAFSYGENAKVNKNEKRTVSMGLSETA